MKFKQFYQNRPQPVGTVLDLETNFVDQSEADRCSLTYQLERFGMEGLQQKLQQTMNQFGYADTRLTKDFQTLAQSYADANAYFQQLPAQIRKEFGHDCTRFYSEIEKNPKYMYDKGYISEKLANELGVIKNDEIVTNSVLNNTVEVGSVEPTLENNESA